MSAPLPQSALDGHCSAIDNDTLYVLSSNSFQSLPLKEHGNWTSLPQGQAVTGPACVRAVPNGDESQAALYVIGGSSSDSSYSGLQKYTFSSQKWETITPTTLDMQGRTNHSAAYLNDTQSILVYAGSQPQAYSDLSSQTFVISTNSPYNIRSFTSKAPPANLPILLPWDDNSAIMVGGSSTNTQVWTFDPDNDGWSEFQTNLSQPIQTGVKGTIVDGSDGSKVLETYDMTVSPNKVSQIVLLGAGGQTATTGQTIGSSKKRKRALTLQNWPSYNSTNAPSVTRSDYTVAQDPNGMSVISGGNTGAPVNIFNENENSWVDNGLFFDGKANNNQVPLLTPSTTTNPSPSPTSSADPSGTSATTILDNDSSRHHMLKVLGITLGTLCGIAALFIILLLLIRWRKLRKRRQQTYIDEKGDRMSFQDRGASFMKEAGGSHMDLSRVPPNHRFTEHNSSHNSFAIMAGKFGRRTSRMLGPRNGDGRGSSESTRQLVKPRKADISRPMELDIWGHDKEVAVNQMSVDEGRRHDYGMTTALGAGAVAGAGVAAANAEHGSENKRTSGWSRYFAPGEGQLPSAYDRNAQASAHTSHYTDDTRPTMPSRIPSSALVPPLDFGRGDDERFSRVNTGSPSFNNSAEDLARRGSSIDAARGKRAHISGGGNDPSHLATSFGRDDMDDASATGSSRTYSTSSDHFSSSDYMGGDHSTAASAWTPVSHANSQEIKPTILDPADADFLHHSPELLQQHIPRPASSNYTSSVYNPTDSRYLPSRGGGGGGGSGFFPGNRETYTTRNKGLKSSSSPNPGNGVFPSSPLVGNGGIKNTGLQVPASGAGVDRDSTATVFPRGVPSAYYANKGWSEGKGPASDMSWLRLDDGSQNRI